ncbi:MAG TPA: hypothetical protein ENI79_04805 [Rhodospirillales bacterium]|nr:hypothetical protein [Rhodospirillales bacterium]
MKRDERAFSIVLSDLTHTGQMVAANTFPLGVGVVAAHARKVFGERLEVELYRYPDDLNQRLAESMPDVAGFANFLWNKQLSYRFVERIKALSPGTVTVFGGSNYPRDEGEQAAFLAMHPAVDFHVFLEGELAFQGLLEALLEADFNAEAIKAGHRPIPGIHYLACGELVRGESPPRIRNLTDTPSPYLEGLMDKFFDGVLIPMLETNRGCPFSCSFCLEGDDYFNKVRWADRERIHAELDYIAEHGKAPDLLITDSNFGMFKEDLETCRKLAALKNSHGWPKYVLNSSGKNRKERVMEAASILEGSLVLTSSIQSADETVLANVRRKNISLEQVIEVGKFSERLGANSYSEVILAMPGDTTKAHMHSVNALVDAGINYVMMYQMLMLPGADVGRPESRRRFGMDTRYRIMPRSFGIYEILGETFPIAETEEICIGTEGLSFQDYLDCRTYNLTVEIFYNGGVFRELINYLKRAGIKASTFTMRVHDTLTGSDNELVELYEGFVHENAEKLWMRRENLEEFTRRPGVVEKFITGELGSSEIYKYKTTIFFWHQKVLHDIAFGAAGKLLDEAGLLDDRGAHYLDDLDQYCLLRKELLHETGREVIREFGFDFISLAEGNFEDDPLSHELPKSRPIRIYHDSAQQELIAQYRVQYGKTVSGLGRLLARTNVNTLYRKASYSL